MRLGCSGALTRVLRLPICHLEDYHRNLIAGRFRCKVPSRMDRAPMLQPAAGFSRRMLSRNRMLIQSTCDYCGLKIVGSIFEALLENEREHRTKCKKPSSAASAMRGQRYPRIPDRADELPRDAVARLRAEEHGECGGARACRGRDADFRQPAGRQGRREVIPGEPN